MRGRPGSRFPRRRHGQSRSRRFRTAARLGSTHRFCTLHQRSNTYCHTPGWWGSIHLGGRSPQPRNTLRHRACRRHSRPRRGTFPRRCSRRCRKRGPGGSMSRSSGTAGLTRSRPVRTSDSPGSSHLAGSLRHRRSRRHRTPRRQDNTHRRCRHLRRCSTCRGRTDLPGNTWSRCTPAQRGSTGSRRQHCLGSTRRRRTLHRRSNNHRRSRAHWGSTPRHGNRRRRHSTSRRTPVP